MCVYEDVSYGSLELNETFIKLLKYVTYHARKYMHMYMLHMLEV